MFHENLKGNVIREDRGATFSAVIEHIIVRLGRVHFRQEESCLGATGLRDDVTGHRESGLKNLLGVIDGSLEQLGEVFILGLVLVVEFLPSGDGLPVIDDNVKESVHQQDPVRLQRRSIEQDWLRRSVKGVRIENRLNHD